MKSWLRARKSDSGAAAATPQDQGPMPPINTKSIPPSQARHHEWDALTGSAAASVAEPPPPAEPRVSSARGSSPGHGARDGNKQTTKQLIDAAAARIVAEPLTRQQHILVRSEHYFRLVLESWEQLRACHFRASQKFSLAEWMHIHALLLYGRIQAVRAGGAVAEHNRIDLSADAPVFDPLATVLNTIGVVQDKETGVTYVPDALFPAEAYSPSEMQHILDGTMYDWQRSWKRVLEARHLRDTKHTQYALVRSSSELIFAIREKTELIARIQHGPQPRRGSFVLDDYKHELDELHELLEEARNAKDYTIRPPCVRLYDGADSLPTNSLHTSSPGPNAPGPNAPGPNSPHTSSPGTSPAARDSPSLDPRALRRRTSEPEASRTPAREAEVRASPTLDFGLETCSIERVSSSEPSDASEPSSVETLSPLDAQKQASANSSEVSAVGMKLPASMKLPALRMEGRPGDRKAASPLRSAMRKGSATLLQDLGSRPAPVGPFDASLMNIANSSDMTLQTESPAKELEALPQPPAPPRPAASLRTSGAASRGSPQRHRVQLAGAADAPDCFVHFDARIWEEYEAFADALRSTRLITFGRLKQELDGGYAWMLPVKLMHGTGSPSSMPAAGDEHAPQPPAARAPPPPPHSQELLIRLPHTSIPRSDQALALLLQTSSLPPEISNSWHVETRAALDMRRFVLEFVNTGIFDSRAM